MGKSGTAATRPKWRDKKTPWTKARGLPAKAQTTGDVCILRYHRRVLVGTKKRNEFYKVLWGRYELHGRHDLPWRKPESNGAYDPYKVLVSELMLQQTQVSRVIPKYVAFLQRFPTVHALARADLGDVLRAWQGLGYNRRAKFLWQAAQAVVQLSDFPKTYDELVCLPGVGPNTAGAILAYTYNLPTIFVETNIRTVYIHHFARDAQNVSDSFIRDCLQRTIDVDRPREFYWALMDYGSWLKTSVRNNAKSAHYVKQSPFDGSRRQVRGKVLRHLANRPLSPEELQHCIDDPRLTTVLAELVAERMIRYTGGQYCL